VTAWLWLITGVLSHMLPHILALTLF